MRGQVSLSNFFESVRFHNHDLAMAIQPDVMMVAMYGLAADKSPAKEAAERLRVKAFDLPEIQKRVLENALEDLGF